MPGYGYQPPPQYLTGRQEVLDRVLTLRNNRKYKELYFYLFNQQLTNPGAMDARGGPGGGGASSHELLSGLQGGGGPTSMDHSHLKLLNHDKVGQFHMGTTFNVTAPGLVKGPLLTGYLATLYGGDAANADLTLEGTAHATKTSSYVILQPNGGNVGIGTTTPAHPLHLVKALTSTNTYFAQFDDGTTGGYLAFGEATSTGGAYFPLLNSLSVGLDGTGLEIRGQIPAANDAYTAQRAAVMIDGRQSPGASLTSADLLAVRNYGAAKARIASNGSGWFAGNLGVGMAFAANVGLNQTLDLADPAVALTGHYVFTRSNQDDYQNLDVIGLDAHSRINVRTTPPGTFTGSRSIAVRGTPGTSWGGVPTGVSFLASASIGASQSMVARYGVYFESAVLAGGATIGTSYALYAPIGNATTRWGVYIADTGAKSYFAEQVQVQAGAANDLSLCSLASTTDGIYFPSNAIGLVIGGTEQWRLTGTAFYPIADNAETLGTSTLAPSALYLSDANSTHVSAEGEVRINDGHSALTHLINGAEHYNGNGLFAGPTADDVITGHDAVAEQAFATSFTIPAAYWQAAKGFRVTAYALAESTATSGGIHFRIRLGWVDAATPGLEVAVENMTWAAGKDLAVFRLVGELTVRSKGPSGTVVAMSTAEVASGATADTLAASTRQLMLRDGGETVATNADQTIAVTVYTTASPGDWSASLLSLWVETIK